MDRFTCWSLWLGHEELVEELSSNMMNGTTKSLEYIYEIEHAF